MESRKIVMHCQWSKKKKVCRYRESLHALQQVRIKSETKSLEENVGGKSWQKVPLPPPSSQFFPLQIQQM